MGSSRLRVAPESLLLRVDGNAGIGGGHVMRCLALAQAWREAGGRAAFASAALASSLRQRILDEGFQCYFIAVISGSQHDAAETAAIAGRCSAATVVIDGYHFDDRFRKPLHAAGLLTVAIDDNGEAGHCADALIVNQNIHASADLYRYGEARSKLLLGTDYVLLRREFRERIRAAGSSGPVRSILVTMGAADRDNATSRVIHGLRAVSKSRIEIRVVVGGENPHRREIEEACSSLPGANVDPDPGAGMAALIAGADIAVTAGGSTMWELAAMGVPFVSIVVAENQRRSALAMGALGFPGVTAANIETELPARIRELIPDAARRQMLSDTGRRLVDGQGASRVCREILGLARGA
jgi:UDP-2,4-diacetamido-2,4,6-trideoxy-beta-L-altropyranose hydrolase